MLLTISDSNNQIFFKEIDNDQLIQIKQILNLSSSQQTQIISLVRDKGYSDETALKVLDFAFKQPEIIQQFNSTNIVNLSAGNILQFINCESLLHYTPSTIPSTGKGELLISLATCNSSKSLKKGDLIIDGKIIELKCSGGRVGGQKDYGSAQEVAQSFFNETTVLLNQYNLQIDLDLDGFHITKTRKGLLDYIAPQLITAGASSDQIRAIYKKSWMKFYSISMLHDFDWVDQLINDQGQIIDLDEFNNFCLDFAIRYYMIVDGFDYLLMLCTKKHLGNYRMFSYSDIFESRPSNWLKILSLPQYNSAARQSWFFSVDLK